MAKVAKKKLTDSNQKRTPSELSKTSLASSRSSKNSMSSMNSQKTKSNKVSKLDRNNRKSEKKDRGTFKTIYKASDDQPEEEEKEESNVTSLSIAWFQAAIIIYQVISMVIQYFWGRNDEVWFMIMEILLLELFASFQLIQVTRRPYIGTACFFLSVQYVLLFLLFSMFLHSPYSSKSSFLERFFGMAAVSLMSSGLHFFIVTQSMRLIGNAEKRNDYSKKVIVEGVEKRRKDLYTMISELISEICYDDKDLKVNLTIRDETGRPKTMRGAGVEAGVNRVLEMSTDGRRINLSTSNTTLTRINVPKHKSHHSSKKNHKKHGESNHDAAPIIDSKYNNCTKQEKMLSPRKILK
ncbi:hypothetical protein CRE_28555 [Caenorhabditis remanei]|uniref:Uncharacterized protein n=1 Tax=Caenorhabditis remanei TaxID=31234 RepID=E3LN12_CAERE|nr:hypothetical protein CRE_28555 [Caenorhabditis remanei]